MARLPYLSLLLFALPAGALAQPSTSALALTHSGVRAIAAAAHAEAVANEWRVVIAVVDAGGHLLFLERMDDVQLGSLEIAQRKARTAALYRRPTQVFADRLAGGQTAVHQLPNVIPLPGGLPIVVGGQVVGAIGVSGVRGAQDVQIAEAGIGAVDSQTTD